MSTTWVVVGGTIGPPCGPAPAAVTCPATDSGGVSPTADAANYPCPPTPAQQAKGDVCQITYGDIDNDSGVANILFGAETLAPPTTTTTRPPVTTTTARPVATTVAPATGAGSGTTVPATTATTTAATGSLAFTGPGPGIGWLGIIGGVLLLFGVVLLFALPNGPRRAFASLITRDGIRELSAPLDHDPKSDTGHPLGARLKRLGHVEHPGSRLGDRLSGAPAMARGVTHRVASASIRTASWFLGR